MRAMRETATLSTGMPVVFPTLTGRAHGIFWQTSASDQCLVLFPSAADKSPPLRETLFRLGLYGRLAGLNVLEVLGGDVARAGTHEVSGNDGWRPYPDAGHPLAITLLATLAYLRSRAIAHVALVYSFDVTELLHLHELAPYLLVQSLSASGVLTADIAEFTQRLERLSDTIQTAVASISGIACLQNAVLTETTAHPSANVYFCSLPTPPLLSDSVDVWPAVQNLYQWVIASLSAPAPSAGAPASEQEAATPTTLATEYSAQRLYERRRAAELSLEYHRSAASLRATMRERLRDLQIQWEALCLDLDERNRFRGNAIKKALLARHAEESYRPYDEASAFARMMRDVRRCWPLLDTLARRRWLAAWTRAVAPDQEPFLSSYLPTDE